MANIAGTMKDDMRRLNAESRELYRHNKSDGVYEIICNANMEATGELMVVYRNIETGERWIRPATQFNDGRFTRLSA